MRFSKLLAVIPLFFSAQLLAQAIEASGAKAPLTDAQQTARFTQTRDCDACPLMVRIPGGAFTMGSPVDENGREDDEGPTRQVTIESFALAQTEVTQAQWRAIMGSSPSNFDRCGDSCPVEKVRWQDAQIYLERLSRLTGKLYRLPGEAEWEYACRAGGAHRYCGADDLDQIGWHSGNSSKSTHPAAGKQANAFGLFDMTGNVWEWVADCYHSSYIGAPENGSAWTAGNCEYRVLRGGSWNNEPPLLRAAIRASDMPNYRDYLTGFLPALTLP